VVFGRRSTDTIDLAALGGGGFRIDGAAAWDRLTAGFGAAVAGAGDVNGDGVPDVIVGAPFADPTGRTDAGAAYVVFGKGSSDPVNLGALGANGFEIDGSESREETGFSVSGAGDFNGDGLADLLVGSPWNRIYTGRTGEAELVFGKRIPSPVLLSAFGGVDYLRIVGQTNDQAGYSVATIGDVNGDRRPDFLIGAIGGQPHLPLAPAGAAFVVTSGQGGLVRIGRASNQTYIGGSGNDYIDGARGDDVIYGLGGNDKLLGGDGTNRVYGGDGNDFIMGRTGNEVLDGGPGNDYINGGYGRDRIYGGPGDDNINAGDGTPDFVDCGPGNDRVFADRKKDRLRGCERVRWRP
jgi:Ca2+-binding RTX toxin-like protein